ncbi:uncharacterized protein Bfra_006068 [Botrytis fragariae]|uniref:Uncharacterized protein n=1 Tax=Botrytis fragariae TaxID=1964551 RepID=A0A8H6AST0_9HELO|nr:uncharacterized protein Bfra_006068 [Botrytis fragariae]KAF5872705.1 hypothetical protein Bfra_006068 [Botrytis fragariae]
MTAINFHECLITDVKQRAFHRPCRLTATVPTNLMQKLVQYSSVELSGSGQLINYPRVDNPRLSIKILHKTYAVTTLACQHLQLRDFTRNTNDWYNDKLENDV